MSSSLPARRVPQPADQAAFLDLALLESTVSTSELGVVLSWLDGGLSSARA